MKNYEITNQNISTFLTLIRENVRAGHYIQVLTEEKNIIGKVTYITSDYIYIDKVKIALNSLVKISRISKKDYEEMY